MDHHHETVNCNIMENPVLTPKKILIFNSMTLGRGLENPTIENCEKEGSIRQWKEGAALIVGDSVLAGIEEIEVYPEIGVKSSNLSQHKSPRYVQLFETLAKKESI